MNNLVNGLSRGATDEQVKYYCHIYSTQDWNNDYWLSQVATIGTLPDNVSGWKVVDLSIVRFLERAKYFPTR